MSVYVGEVHFHGFAENSGTKSLVSLTAGPNAAAIDIQQFGISYDDNLTRWRRGGLVKGVFSPERTVRFSLRCILTSYTAHTEAEVKQSFRLPGGSTTIGSLVIATLSGFDATNANWLNNLAGIVVSGAYNLQHNEPNEFTLEIEHNPNLTHTIRNV